jgi:hypothetical protein
MRNRFVLPFGVMLLVLPAMGCPNPLTPETTKEPLTLARALEGTWSSAVPLTMTYQTDYCGPKQAVATSKWNVTWTLTAVAGFSNVLDVEMHYTAAAQTRLASNCGNGSNGWFSIPPPIFLRMTVSSSAYTATDTGNGISVSGSYTTDLMNGTWNHYDCVIYCFGEYTAAQEFKLVRQR